VATAFQPLFRGASGNNVRLPNEDKGLFNIADLYGIDEHYIDLMEISIVEGKGFERGISTERDMIVSRSFAGRIVEDTGWTDGVVGKDLWITEHGLCSVIGMYNDVRLGLINGGDSRPSAMFYSPIPASVIFIRFHKLSGVALQKAIDALQTAMPEKDIVVTPYKDSILMGYNNERLFRNSVMTGGIIALILSLIGLLSYLRSEINRRSSEVAIRKVNGATIANVLILFAKNVFYLAVPALTVGAAVAAYVAEEWMKSFSQKVTPGLFLFILCGLAILSITLGILTIGCRRVAVQNPVHSLKTE
jgi:putative ABC transport system permease protein